LVGVAVLVGLGVLVLVGVGDGPGVMVEVGVLVGLGVFVGAGVLVLGGVAVGPGVLVGVLDGSGIHVPVAFRFTDDRTEVLYWTATLALPGALKLICPPAASDRPWVTGDWPGAETV
jgi:hypothetical protein